MTRLKLNTIWRRSSTQKRIIWPELMIHSMEKIPLNMWYVEIQHLFCVHWKWAMICFLLMSTSVWLQYYLNVCRSLVPQYHLGCRGNTAICRAVNITNELRNETVRQMHDDDSINIQKPKYYQKKNMFTEPGLSACIADHGRHPQRRPSPPQIHQWRTMRQRST